MYYSAGLLSKKDIYPEHKSAILKNQEPKSVREKKDKTNSKEANKPIRRRSKKSKEDETETEMMLTSMKTEPGTPGPSNVEIKDHSSDLISKFSSTSIKKEPVDLAEPAHFSFESDVDESGGLFGNVIETGSGLQSPSPVPSISPSPHSPSPNTSPKTKKKKKDRIKKEKGEKKGKSKKEKGPPSVKALIAQRRKLWLLICKKEISKVYIMDTLLCLI